MTKNITTILACLIGLISTNTLFAQSVGNLSGELSVNENGAATYSIDIPCPSGINGMQPKISLNYNSQSGQGIAGWGWNIGGLSMISHATPNYYYDNDKSSMSLNTDPSSLPLTLDGQRLIQYDYKPGRRVRPDSTWYYIENDKTTKVILDNHGGRIPSVIFTVIQKNGTIMEYGAQGSSDLSPEYQVGDYKWANLGWALTKVSDSYGNFIQYDYGSEKVGNKTINTRLNKITYGNGDGYVVPKIIVAQIEFKYKTRTDPAKQYINGIQIINNNVLTGIDIKDSRNSIIESCELTHSSVENKDFLTTIKKKNAANEYFNPVTFNYNTPSYRYENGGYLSFVNRPSGYKNFMTDVLGDIDGDGFIDILAKSNNYYLTDESGLWTLYRNSGNNRFEPVIQKNWSCQMETNFLFLDLDNDGKDELYFGNRKVYNGGYYYYLDCYKYQNGTLVQQSASSLKFSISKAVYDAIGNKKDRQYIRVLPADFIGNGNTQFVLLDKDNRIIAQQGLPNFSYTFFGGVKNAQVFLADFNGNGKTEIAYIVDNNTTVYEFTKQSNTSGVFNTLFTSSQFNRKDQIRTGDFNGDGNTDLLVKHYNNNSYTKPWKIYFSNGNNSLEVKDMSSYLSGYPTGVGFNSAYVIDANNDGKSDILYSQPNFVNSVATDATIGLLISDGYNFTNKVLDSKGQSYNGFYSSGTFKNTNAKDIFIYINYNQRLFTLNKNLVYNKLIKVTDGFGLSQNITYQNYNNPIPMGNALKSGYALDGTDQVLKSSSAKIEVVKSITGTNINTSYQFSDPYFHKQGRGFLGFMKTTKIDNISNIKIYSEKKLNSTFYILYPYKTVSSLNSTGQIISESTQNFTIVNEGNKVYFVRIDSEVSKDNLNNTTTTTSYSNYDDSRNAKTIKIDYGNNIKEEKNYVWIKVNSEYFNRVQSSTIIKSIPNEANYVKKEEFEYNSKGRLIKAISDKGTVKMVTTSYFDFDKYGNEGKVTVATANGTRTQLKTYTGDGRFLASKTDHMNKKVTYTYDNKRGLLLTETDELGTINYQYDNWGRKKKSIYPGNIVIEEIMGWAVTGAPAGAKYYIKTTETGKSPITQWFDALGRIIRKEGYGLNNQLVYSDIVYNIKGQVQRETDPYFPEGAIVNAASYTYDEYGRTKTVQQPRGTIQYVYSPLKVTVTTLEGTSIAETNPIGQVIAKTINGKKVTFNYYASGLVKKNTPEGGLPIEMEYDLLGYRTKITDPATGTITSVYDSWGQLIRETQSIHKGQPATVTDYTYDAKGLLLTKKRNGVQTTYSYDSRSRVTNISVSNGYSQAYEYNALNQIIRKTDKIGTERTLVTSTEYDTYGRVSKETYPSGYFVTNTYDANGYLVKINDKNNSLIWQANATNAKGQITKITKGSKSTVYSFDSKSQLTGIVSEGIVNFAYAYDSKGNLASRQDNVSNHKEVFSYDAMNRLTGWNISRNNAAVRSNTMSYYANTGDISNMSELQNYQMNYGELNGPAHALTSINGVPGNLPQIPAQITYTDSKKLKTISEGGNALELFYNADEQRYKSLLKTNGTVKTTRYYAGNYEEEITGGVVKKTHYLYGNNGLAAVYIQNGNTNTLYYAYNDNMGSLVALTDINGVVKERYMYNPWGVRQSPTNWETRDSRTSLIVNRGYSMHEHMREFGLINMNGRVYNPSLAMFISPDPFVQQPGNWLNHNRYTYCLNNPFRYTDPSGEWFGIDDLFVAAAGFVFGYVSHGITEGNWGGKAFTSGLQMAGGAWLGFNTMGVSMGVGNYIGNMAINTVSSMILPSFNIPLSDKFGLSISPALGMGPKGLGGGFNYGLSYKSWSVSAGVGPNHLSYGIGFKAGDLALGYYRTHYGNEVGPDGLPNAQVVGGAVLAIGGFSFRIENDVLGLAGQQDRWRTNAVEVGIGKYFVIGTTLNTNDPKNENREEKLDEAPGRPSLSGKLNKNGLSSWKNGQVYHSPFYIGVKHGNNVYRMGYSHPKVQDMTQNSVHREGFFHTLLPGISKLLPSGWDFGHQNYYVNYENFQKGAYFYYGNQQPHSLWGY